MKNARNTKRNAFVLCAVHHALNAALTDFKKVMCAGNSSTNYNKELNLNKLPRPK